MKIISFALFNHPSAKPFERMAYVRNFFWNCRMIRLIYPEWKIALHLDGETLNEFEALWKWLQDNNGVTVYIPAGHQSVPLCKGMLWRMMPCFLQDVTHVLCRDADALVTYREAQRVQQWLEGGRGCHSILDNPAHSGLMGGMVGFDTAKLKAATSWQTWDQMIEGWDLSQRGSDQNLLNQRVLPHMKTETHVHDSREQNHLLPASLPGVDQKFWESNLCCQFIGSPGVNDLETIRFFKRLDNYDYQVDEVQKQFPKVFYWQA